jgi:Low iron-inducible periplasmic protein
MRQPHLLSLLAVYTALAYAAIVTAQGTDLGGGTVTHRNVTEYAILSLDVDAIRSYIQSSNSAAALNVYKQGKYNQLALKSPTSLQEATLAASQADTKTPLYLFQLYGLADRSIDESTLNKHSQYAQNLIISTLQHNPGLADHAILALGLYMYASHLLFKSVATCAQRTLADKASIIDFDGLDDFIAVWIGENQVSGASDGSGLYGWTQQIGTLFEVAQPEHPVNSRLRLLYAQAATMTSQAKVCTSSSPDSPRDLWKIASQISHAMVVPLFQWLIYFVLEQDREGVHIYATALVPQLSRCRPSVYKSLKDLLLTNSVDFGKTDKILDLIKQAYACFGLTCSDIGSFQNDRRLFCDAQFAALAGYRPMSDVSSLARIDLDIYQMRILTSINSLEYAKYWYMYGFNSPKLRDGPSDPYTLVSLQELATTGDRGKADPIYTQYLDYFNEKYYAHKTIMAALEGNSQWTSTEQVTEVVALTSAYSVVFIHIVAQLNQASLDCQAALQTNEFGSVYSPLDQAAALFIGSMEGPALGGSLDSEDGQMIYGLGDKRAFQFTTLNVDNYAKVNSEIENLLFSARGQLDSLDCASLERTTSRLKKLATLALFQSTIKAAMENEGATNEGLASLAKGQTYANSILPLVAAYDAQTAEMVAENMEYKKGVSPVRDGPEEVADALALTWTQGLGLPCNYLGKTGQVQPCRNLQGGSSAPARRWSMAVLSSILLVLYWSI